MWCVSRTLLGFVNRLPRPPKTTPATLFLIEPCQVAIGRQTDPFVEHFPGFLFVSFGRERRDFRFEHALIGVHCGFESLTRIPTGTGSLRADEDLFQASQGGAN